MEQINFGVFKLTLQENYTRTMPSYARTSLSRRERRMMDADSEATIESIPTRDGRRESILNTMTGKYLFIPLTKRKRPTKDERTKARALIDLIRSVELPRTEIQINFAKVRVEIYRDLPLNLQRYEIKHCPYI